METRKKLRVEPFFRWYDLWIGAYFDRQAEMVYICPLPTLGIKVWLEEAAVCPVCCNEAYKACYNTGEGWALFWKCKDIDCDLSEYAIAQIEEWPFDANWMTAREMMEAGWEVV